MRTVQLRFMQTGGQRRRLSLLGALLYALCAIALPSLHLGLHRADHEHRHGGLQRLYARLGDPHSLALMPHRHGVSLDSEAGAEGGRLGADPSASPDPSDQIWPHAARLRPVSSLLTLAVPSSQHAAPRSSLLGLEDHTSQGSPAPDLAHGSGSLTHFASAFVAAAASIGLPFAGLLCEQTRYLPRAECAPPSRLVSANHARGPPAPVAGI